LTGSMAPGWHHRTPWARPKTFPKLARAWRIHERVQNTQTAVHTSLP
jgi:hypothetical protein